MQRTIRHVYTPASFARQANTTNRILIEPGRWEDYDPFLILVEDKFQKPGGFPDHPHRGIETVTFVLDGELRHADNRGNSGVLGEGDVQWMTAGGGIIHAELPHEESTVHSLQLWLNLPASKKMTESGYQDLRGAESVVTSDDGVSVRVVSGAFEGVEAATQNIVPVRYLEVTVQPGKANVLPVPAAHNGFIHMIEGSARFGVENRIVRTSEVAWLDYPKQDDGMSSLWFESAEGARFLLVTGLPVREPVVAYGPFVMNTEDEIRQAYTDYHAGRFGGPTPAGLEALERAKG